MLEEISLSFINNNYWTTKDRVNAEEIMNLLSKYLYAV